jgi:hypothetical protein
VLFVREAPGLAAALPVQHERPEQRRVAHRHADLWAAA